MAPNEVCFITGATGFLGAEVLSQLLEAQSDCEAVLLVRSRAGRSARDRLPDRFKADSRTRVIEGGLEEFDHAKWEEAGGVTRIIHIGARLDFDADWDSSWAINVGGTRRILEFAKHRQQRGTLKSVLHVSTAFVCGERKGRVLESELSCDQKFRNAYEKTKFLAEAEVRAQIPALPVVIVRPSLVAGDSLSGRTLAFKALYLPLKLLAKGWRWAPGSPEARVDIVPVNFVARAIVHCVFDARALGETLHLCAGPEGELTAGQIGEEAARVFGVAPPVFIRLWYFRWIYAVIKVFLPLKTRKVLARARPYREYFEMSQSFDISTATRILGPAQITPPASREYLRCILDYCWRSDWGRRHEGPV